MTAWTITTTVLFSNMGGTGTIYNDGDSLTINSGGNVTCDLAVWTGSDGSKDSNNIVVNAGGIFTISAKALGTGILDINDANTITINEGGQMRSLGTSGARIAIRGENAATGTHYIRATGGKIYWQYTDVSLFGGCISIYFGGLVEMNNCTHAGGNTNAAIFTYRGGEVKLYNTTVSSVVNRYVFDATGYHGNVYFVNCVFTSVTDNYLLSSEYYTTAVFAGCTYQGVAIAADDFRLTTTDHDIRIYEASTMTVAGNLADCSVSPDHPSLDSLGMLYDSTNYMKIPGYLSCDETNASGISTIYLLKRSAYWPSGLAVVSRTWKYWSDSTQTETGDNQQWTLTASKIGYVTAADTDWAGNAMTTTLSATSKYYTDFNFWVEDATGSKISANDVEVGDVVYLNGAISTNSAISGVSYAIEITSPSGSTTLGTGTVDLTTSAQNILDIIPTAHLEYSIESAGAHNFAVEFSGSGIITRDLDIYFFGIAVSSNPVITAPAISDASISEAESTIVTCRIANMTTASIAFIDFNGQLYEMTTTNYSTYTRTLYGMNLGVVSAGTIQIIAENLTGAATDSTLTLTVTAANTEAVTFINSLLDANWNATNVTKPTILVGGTARSKHRLSTGDLIKIFRSPRPTVREPRFRRNYEYRDEYVQLMIVTTNSSPRDRLDDLQNEVMRIINNAATAPGSGWDKLWIDVVEVRKEFSEEFQSVMDITLTKIITAVNT